MRDKKRQVTKAAKAADFVGIAYFIIGNVLMLVGQFSGAFEQFVGGRYPAIHFVQEYYAAPGYLLLREYLFAGLGEDVLGLLVGAQIVLVLTGILYALLVYIVLKIASFLLI